MNPRASRSVRRQVLVQGKPRADHQPRPPPR
jgi:hypothetical protein